MAEPDSWEDGGYTVTDKPMPRGEVVIGGPCVTAGYFKNEAKTGEVYKVEAGLVASSYVDSIMVHADPFHSFCVALVVPSKPVLESWAKEAGIEFKDFPDLCTKGEAIKEVQQSLSKVAKDAKLEKFEIPAKIMLLPEPWTPESGLVTAALKLKREQLKAKFKDELLKLYQ